LRSNKIGTWPENLFYSGILTPALPGDAADFGGMESVLAMSGVVLFGEVSARLAASLIQ
jgi:hypothetical protein